VTLANGQTKPGAVAVIVTDLVFNSQQGFAEADRTRFRTPSDLKRCRDAAKRRG